MANRDDTIHWGRGEIHDMNLTHPLRELAAEAELDGAGTPEPTTPLHQENHQNTGKEARKRQEPLTTSPAGKCPPDT
jgi:hypothetical protein